MITLITQIVGCLTIATGIGFALGWMLRHLTATTLTQQLQNLTISLAHKDETLEELRLEMNDNASMWQTLEKKRVTAEAVHLSLQETLASRDKSIIALENSLASAGEKLTTVHSTQTTLLTTVNEEKISLSAQMEKIHKLEGALNASQEILALKEQENRVQQDHLAQLEHDQAIADQLRLRIQSLEPAQGRVHWLEVQLSEQNSQYQQTLHQQENLLATQTQRIVELEDLHHKQEHPTVATTALEAEHAHVVQLTTDEQTKTLQETKKLQSMQAQLTSQAAQLRMREQDLATLQKHITVLESALQEQPLTTTIEPTKASKISHLRERIMQIEAALKVKTNGKNDPPFPQPLGKQLSLLSVETNLRSVFKKDDLTLIPGIKPGFEQTLNSMGIIAYQQISQWSVTMIQEVAVRLGTSPAQIKHNKWIATAKKLQKKKL